MQQKLLSEFYDEVKIDPSSLAYVEAHSTGTIVGDPEGNIITIKAISTKLIDSEQISQEKIHFILHDSYEANRNCFYSKYFP